MVYVESFSRGGGCATLASNLPTASGSRSLRPVRRVTKEPTPPREIFIGENGENEWRRER